MDSGINQTRDSSIVEDMKVTKEEASSSLKSL